MFGSVNRTHMSILPEGTLLKYSKFENSKHFLEVIAAIIVP